MKVFISHSSTDKEFVRKFKKDLNENGIVTWFDEDQLDLGDSLIQKIDLGLTDSSHFIIVLSQASTKSNWVEYELKKALNNKAINLINKIIPIKYNDCQVPVELGDLLYGDLSKETRILQGDSVEFLSNEYIRVVDKVCKSIKNSEKQLTKKEIEEIKVVFQKNENAIEKKNSQEVIKGIYQMGGYKDNVARLSFAKKALIDNEINIDNIRPILLPPLWKHVISNIKAGDIISVSKNYFFNEQGHFAGYRIDDTRIIMDGRIRQALSLEKGKMYKVEFNVKEKNLNFLTK